MSRSEGPLASFRSIICGLTQPLTCRQAIWQHAAQSCMLCRCLLLCIAFPTMAIGLCSPALRRLVEMIGRSQKIYKGLAQLCARRLKDSQGLVTGMQEGALCTLRSQLLMALHDANAAQPTQPPFAFTQVCFEDLRLNEEPHLKGVLSSGIAMHWAGSGEMTSSEQTARYHMHAGLQARLASSWAIVSKRLLSIRTCVWLTIPPEDIVITFLIINWTPAVPCSACDADPAIPVCLLYTTHQSSWMWKASVQHLALALQCRSRVTGWPGPSMPALMTRP